MKSIRKRLAVIVAWAFMLMTSVGVVNANVNRVKTYRYDDNIYIGATNFHKYTYKNVPDDARESGRDKSKIGGDWNYTRYQVVIYYKSKLGNY